MYDHVFKVGNGNNQYSKKNARKKPAKAPTGGGPSSVAVDFGKGQNKDHPAYKEALAAETKRRSSQIENMVANKAPQADIDKARAALKTFDTLPPYLVKEVNDKVNAAPVKPMTTEQAAKTGVGMASRGGSKKFSSLAEQSAARDALDKHLTSAGYKADKGGGVDKITGANYVHPNKGEVLVTWGTKASPQLNVEVFSSTSKSEPLVLAGAERRARVAALFQPE